MQPNPSEFQLSSPSAFRGDGFRQGEVGGRLRLFIVGIHEILRVGAVFGWRVCVGVFAKALACGHSGFHPALIGRLSDRILAERI